MILNRHSVNIMFNGKIVWFSIYRVEAMIFAIQMEGTADITRCSSVII